MRLALALGYKSVREMECTLTIQEYREWRDFYLLEPWGCAVEDGRFDLLLTTITTALGGKRPAGGFFPRDPFAHEHEEKQEKSNLENNLRAALMGYNRRAASSA